MAATLSAPTLSTSTAVRAPGPAPTSRTRCPADTPAASAKAGARGSEKRPMELPYAAAVTSKPTAQTLLVDVLRHPLHQRAHLPPRGAHVVGGFRGGQPGRGAHALDGHHLLAAQEIE